MLCQSVGCVTLWYAEYVPIQVDMRMVRLWLEWNYQGKVYRLAIATNKLENKQVPLEHILYNVHISVTPYTFLSY